MEFSKFKDIIIQKISNAIKPATALRACGWQTSSGVCPFLLQVLIIAPLRIRSWKIYNKTNH